MTFRDQERVKRIQQTLKKRDWDALVLFHPDNIVMATGMLPGSSHVTAIVTLDGHITVITPWWRESFVREESWADSVHSFDWCRGFNGVEPIGAITKELKNAGLRLRVERIGYDGRMHHYGPNQLPSEFFTYDEVKGNLTGIFSSAEDATQEINQLKSVKTQYEVEQLRKTHRVAAGAVRAFYENARAGIRETDLAAEVSSAVLKMVGENGIRYTYCDPPQVTSGSQRTAIADTMSNHATSKRLNDGDLVILEVGLHADGYWADITRTLVIGTPTDRQFQVHDAILYAQKSAFAAYQPAKSTGDDLCQAAWQALRDRGMEQGITHFLGHGLGFAYHEDRPVLGPGENSAICEGHVTSVEPGLYFIEKGIPWGGIRVEDNVVWGAANGQVTVLSDFPRGLQ